MKINPDGLSLAIGDRNGNIRIFSMEIFQQIALVEAHDSEVLSVDYTHSSSMGLFLFSGNQIPRKRSSGVTFLASSSRDRFVHIFNVTKDYQLVATLDDHSAAITAVRFTFYSITSNLQLVSCSADKSLIFRTISKVIFDAFLLEAFFSIDLRMTMANISLFARIILWKSKPFMI